jgi:hypothetical protein
MLGLRATVCALLLMSQQPQAQPAAPPQRANDAPPVQQSLDKLNALLARVPNASLSANFAEWRVRVVVSKLRTLSANWPLQSPADYRANLDGSVRAMEQAVTVRDPDRLTAILEALADDLEVKLEHCNQSGGKLGGSVIVRVRTVQDGQEIRNWQVFYLPKVLEAIGADSADRFPQLSSPTNETLVPGRYVMWLQDPSTRRVSDRTIVKVGEGKAELQLDLPVPAGPPR